MILEDIIGGGSSNTLWTQIDTSFEPHFIKTSANFTATEAGTYLVLLSGGGGSGAIGTNYNISQSSLGGNSGDMQVAEATLSLNEVVAVSIGAGGVKRALTASGNGDKGGISSFGSYFQTLDIDNGGVHSLSTTSENNKNGYFVADSISSASFQSFDMAAVLSAIGRPSISNSKTNGVNFSSYLNKAGGGARSLLGNGGAASVNGQGGGLGAGGSGGLGVGAGANGSGGNGFAIIFKLKD